MSGPNTSEILDTKFDEKYWNKRWVDNDLRWHKDVYNEFLLKYADKLLFKSKSVHKAFVPLCGKSLDMKWLYDQGCKVVGVEYIESSVQDFFVEQNIKYTKKQINGVAVYESEDQRITLWCCDLFDFPKLSGEKDIEVVWDRGSFVAINFDEREKYVELMHSLVAEDFRWLIERFIYDPHVYGGPPKTSSEAEMERLFGSLFDQELLIRQDHDMSKYGFDKGEICATLVKPKRRK